MPESKDHISIRTAPERRAFQSPLSVRNAPVPPRDHVTHGRRLLRALADLRVHDEALARAREDLDLPTQGTKLVLEISPKRQLNYQSLEWVRDGVEVLSVTEAPASEIVVLFVPEGRLAALEMRIEQYLTATTPSGGRRNGRLINVIENIRRAAFDEFWTDVITPPPADEMHWFQIWLRLLPDGARVTRERFAALAEQLDIEVEPGFVTFPGRVVVAAHGTRATLESAAELLDAIAEIRSVQPTADFFLTELKRAEQARWIRDLAGRTQAAESAQSPPYVALLDTGVNHGHPLLSSSVDGADLHTIDVSWNVTDHHGHGTQMAGLILHGDLVASLSGTADHAVPHRLESIKILPPTGQNPSHLYGWITATATRSLEQSHPERRRSFAMMTTSVGTTTGAPSEWSATIDRLAFGAADDTLSTEGRMQVTPRLFVLASGNVPWPEWTNYPARNDLFPMESPSQSWNAIVVGAATHLTDVDAATWPSLAAIAPAGRLSPCASTSMSWTRSWPSKPDVVAEGGNGCLDAGIHPIVGPESLRLLTTGHDMTTGPLVEAGDTSAAAAEVARLCGLLAARYPTYWPETLRGLIVHGARYTAGMLSGFPHSAQRDDKEIVLRRYGHGLVQAANSLTSTLQRPTLVVQQSIAPYRRDAGTVKLNAIDLHQLPWPTDALTALGASQVKLRITLSYFVDPNPSQRGWQGRFRYQSHGLRFAIKGASETIERFNQRINRLERDLPVEDEVAEAIPDPDREGWMFGPQVHRRGSLHSDVWTGTAVQLAAKSGIAIYPVGGWWKDWSGAHMGESEVRYALIISLEVAEDLTVDIYSPIVAQIQTPVEITSR